MQEEKMKIKLTKVPSMDWQKPAHQSLQKQGSYLLQDTQVIPVNNPLKMHKSKTVGQSTQQAPPMAQLPHHKNESMKKSYIKQVKRIPPSLSEFPNKFVNNYKINLMTQSVEDQPNIDTSALPSRITYREARSQQKHTAKKGVLLDGGPVDTDNLQFFHRRNPNMSPQAAAASHYQTSHTVTTGHSLSMNQSVKTPQPYSSNKFAQQALDQRLANLAGVEHDNSKEDMLDQSVQEREFIIYQNAAMSYKSDSNQANKSYQGTHLKQMVDTQTRLLNKLVHKGSEDNPVGFHENQSRSLHHLQLQHMNINKKPAPLSKNEGVLKAKSKVINIMRHNTGWISGARHSSNTRASHRSNAKSGNNYYVNFKPASLTANQPPVLMSRKTNTSLNNQLMYQSKFEVDPMPSASRLPKIPGSPLAAMSKSALSAMTGLRSTSQPRQVQLPAAHTDPQGAPYLLFTTDISKTESGMDSKEADRILASNTLSPYKHKLTAKSEALNSSKNESALPPKNPKKSQQEHRRMEVAKRIAKIYDEPRPKLTSSRQQPKTSHRSKSREVIKLNPSLVQFHDNLKQIDQKFSKLRAKLESFSKVTQSTKRQLQETQSLSDNNFDVRSRKSDSMSLNSLLTVSVEDF